MKAPIKAEAAAKMLHEVIYSLTPVIYSEWKADDIIRLQVRARAIVYYRLCPIAIINVSESDTLEELKKMMIENRLWTGDDFFMEVFNVLISFNIVSIDDLENEFIELSPDIDSFERYLEFIIKPIYTKLPNYQNMGNLCIKEIGKTFDFGQIQSIDTDMISANIRIISHLIKQVYGRICASYNNLLPQKTTKQVGSIADFPNELNSIKVIDLLNIAVKAGLLNSDYSPTDKTKTKAQKALLAAIISEKANIKNKWKPFESLWQVKGLSQQRYDSREKVGKVRGGDEIEQAFR